MAGVPGLVAEKGHGRRRLHQRLAEWPHDLRGLVGQTVHDPHQPGTHMRGPQIARGGAVADEQEEVVAFVGGHGAQLGHLLTAQARGASAGAPA
ncbi:hypothetical protein [Streptomyces antibioticus]|uniref:hypothetical protein n=1 Tax=Streptomyces antibioticus TaxID=1890 RepID=UPI0037967A6C